ncbi:DUF4168 domain-containing protein [Leptolyngbya ohadii]|uniref:DUF4168 domain-containing protein n=1 Tax=Leptolyngbya ohadii TaxID=1962290 RepID=UPI001CEC7992|nr:DUF4168 domain-containing protein [Leptolyngbya ohadii]
MKRWLLCVVRLMASLIAIVLLNLLTPIAAWSEQLPVAEEAPVTTTRSPAGVENISSEKLDQFIQAYLQVTMLIEQKEDALQGAETNSESVQMQREIAAEAVAKIDEAGLTLQEYLQLLRLANLDPEFGERVAIQLQEAAE